MRVRRPRSITIEGSLGLEMESESEGYREKQAPLRTVLFLQSNEFVHQLYQLLSQLCYCDGKPQAASKYLIADQPPRAEPWDSIGLLCADVVGFAREFPPQFVISVFGSAIFGP